MGALTQNTVRNFKDVQTSGGTKTTHSMQILSPTKGSVIGMIQSWQLQEAKNKFSRVVENAVNEGPQIITRHGKEVAIVISFSEYQRIVRPGGSLSNFFQDSPLVGVELDVTRDSSSVRGDFDL